MEMRPFRNWDIMTRHRACTDLQVMSSLVIMAMYVVSRLADDKGRSVLYQST